MRGKYTFFAFFFCTLMINALAAVGPKDTASGEQVPPCAPRKPAKKLPEMLESADTNIKAAKKHPLKNTPSQ